MTTKLVKTALGFFDACDKNGFTIVIKQETVVAITARFPPKDKDAFVAFDMIAGAVLDLLGARGGSQWGTDGGSVGGAVALERGHFVLNQSGVPKKLVKALKLKLDLREAIIKTHQMVKDRSWAE